MHAQSLLTLSLIAWFGIGTSSPPPPEPEKRDEEKDGEPDQMPPNKRKSES